MNDILNREIIYLRSVDSTNLYCLREVDTIDSGTVVVADGQTFGRGRHSRRWFSPEGENLYCSILLKKPPTLIDFSLLAQVSPLAILRAIKYRGVENAWIKWPNDVYVKNLKIAGVLSECTTRNNTNEIVVVGIGVNLNMSQDTCLTIDKPATSILLETNRMVHRDEFLNRLIYEFNELCRQARISGKDSIYQQWKAASKLKDCQVEIKISDSHSMWGKVLDFDPDGSIIIESNSGEKRKFIAGDVSLTMPDGIS